VGNSQDAIQDSVKDGIWLTAHIRMVAEKRYRKYDYVFNLLLCWRSLTVATWATIRSSQPPSPMLDTYAAVISGLVFAFSIITFGFRFGETAASYRDCYLRLQKLHDSENDPAILNREYHEILAGCNNQGEQDFDDLVLSRTLFVKRHLRGKDGREITWTGWMLARSALRFIIFWGAACALFALGLYPYLIVFKIL